MRQRHQLVIGIWCGIVPLVGGTIIFLSWFISRILFAHDLSSFEGLGLYWIIISLPIVLFGIISMLLFVSENFKQQRKKSLIGLLTLLINFPIAILILDSYDVMNERVYLKVSNNSQSVISSVTLKSKTFEKTIGNLKSEKTAVIQYKPNEIHIDDSFYIRDSVWLMFNADKQHHSMLLPDFYKGQCGKIIIDENYSFADVTSAFEIK